MNTHQPAPLLLTDHQVAELLGIGKSTVGKYANEDILQPVRLGGITRFRRDAIVALVEGLPPATPGERLRGRSRKIAPPVQF